LNLTNSGNVLTIREDAPSGWEQYVLLMSDNHHDSPLCDRKLEEKHLKEARAKGAWILQAGDLFDAMQGRKDPRSSYDNLDPALKGDDYLDRLVRFNGDFLAPYAENILLMARGNHETSALKHYGVDLTSNLVYRLRSEYHSQAVAGGYGGWVRFLFTMDKTKRASLNLKYFHGAGGGAPVTRGIIATNRQAVYLPDADIVWNGHNHEGYVTMIQRERISNAGKLFQDVQWHVRTPGYMNGYRDGSSGWAVESGMAPTPLGCVWLRLFREGDRIRVNAIQDVR
jgi:predicted phosphodiesterase